MSCTYGISYQFPRPRASDRRHKSLRYASVVLLRCAKKWRLERTRRTVNVPKRLYYHKKTLDMNLLISLPKRELELRALTFIVLELQGKNEQTGKIQDTRSAIKILGFLRVQKYHVVPWFEFSGIYPRDPDLLGYACTSMEASAFRRVDMFWEGVQASRYGVSIFLESILFTERAWSHAGESKTHQYRFWIVNAQNHLSIDDWMPYDQRSGLFDLSM